MEHHQTEPGTHKHQITAVSTDNGHKAAVENSTLYNKLTGPHKQCSKKNAISDLRLYLLFSTGEKTDKRATILSLPYK